MVPYTIRPATPADADAVAAMIVAGGHRDLELHVRTDNVDPIDFYVQSGCTVTDRTIETVEHGVNYRERILVKHHT